jgi:hypothetical protein
VQQELTRAMSAPLRAKIKQAEKHTIISAVMEFAGQGYLYQGYLDSFYFDSKGNIDRLVLTNTARRKIENDKTDSAVSVEDRFYLVDGDYFVLKYAEIKNLNIQFIKLQLEPIN